MIQNYFNDVPLLQTVLLIEPKLIGSWLSELDHVRTMKGYTFNLDGSGLYFLWYSYEKLLAEVVPFSYGVEKGNIILVFESFFHRHIIPFEIEKSQLKLKMQYRLIVFTKHHFY